MCAMLVASTAMCQCTMGKAPVPLNATSAPTVLAENKSAATIMDFATGANLPPFGVCTAPLNPAYAASGYTVPPPCTLVPAGTWMPGQPKVLIKGKPALTNSCKLICAYGGVISITNPGTTHTQC